MRLWDSIVRLGRTPGYGLARSVEAENAQGLLRRSHASLARRTVRVYSHLSRRAPNKFAGSKLWDCEAGDIDTARRTAACHLKEAIAIHNDLFQNAGSWFSKGNAANVHRGSSESESEHNQFRTGVTLKCQPPRRRLRAAVLLNSSRFKPTFGHQPLSSLLSCTRVASRTRYQMAKGF